jgi:hypothetical protein
MYAHQVIHKLNVPETLKTEEITGIFKNIKKSTQFHFVDLVCANEAGGKYFWEYMRLPYKVTWIDFINNINDEASKGAYLCIQGDVSINIFSFDFLASEKFSVLGWHLYPYILSLTEKGRVICNLLGEGETPESAVLNFIPVFGFLQILNCKNIVAEKIPAPEALNKKRRKSGKQELFDYHVLNVVVPSKKRGYHETTEPLSHNRVHLCRGHFKEYTAEHPLFGHYTGLYWWQPHVRGQNKDGIVMKDYKVTTKQ